jgi:hypothetical protein
VDNPPERKFLAYFRGTIFHREGNAYSRGLRPRLHALFANETDIIYGTKKKDCDRQVNRVLAGDGALTFGLCVCVLCGLLDVERSGDMGLRRGLTWGRRGAVACVDRQCYRQEMTESKFCLNPLGWSPWTLRFYQAVMTRCIPVLIADDIEFPFESEARSPAPFPSSAQQRRASPTVAADAAARRSDRMR